VFLEVGSDSIIHQFTLIFLLIMISPGFLQYARPQMLAFMFRHGHYTEACSLFFPFSQPTTEGETSLSSIPSDPLTTDYGTIDDLCDLCLGYGAMAVLENTIRTITQSPTYHEAHMIQYMNTVLTRICNYCETHRHFNYLYNFLVLSISSCIFLWIP
jgi:zinc finger FYVE domain-containing protein 26